MVDCCIVAAPALVDPGCHHSVPLLPHWLSSPVAIITVPSFISPLCISIFVLGWLVLATIVALIAAVMAPALSSLSSWQPASSFSSLSCAVLFVIAPSSVPILPSQSFIPLYNDVGRGWGGESYYNIGIWAVLRVLQGRELVLETILKMRG